MMIERRRSIEGCKTRLFDERGHEINGLHSIRQSGEDGLGNAIYTIEIAAEITVEKRDMK